MIIPSNHEYIRPKAMTPNANRRSSRLTVSTASDIYFTRDVTSQREGPISTMGNKARARYSTRDSDTFGRVFKPVELKWDPQRASQLKHHETSGRNYDILSGKKL